MNVLICQLETGEMNVLRPHFEIVFRYPADHDYRPRRGKSLPCSPRWHRPGFSLRPGGGNLEEGTSDRSDASWIFVATAAGLVSSCRRSGIGVSRRARAFGLKRCCSDRQSLPRQLRLLPEARGAAGTGQRAIVVSASICPVGVRAARRMTPLERRNEIATNWVK